MRIITTLTLILLAVSLRAELKLDSYFADHMVLQREALIPVQGTAAPGAHIKGWLVSLEWNVPATAKADANGDFQLMFSPLEAGGPYRMIVEDGTDKIDLKDIMVGDVWVCSGQSNMQWPLDRASNAESAISRSWDSGIRLLSVKRLTAMEEQDQAEVESWQPANPESSPSFSAVGYFFGQELYHRTGVPIGLIHSSWGGTPVESWINRSGFESSPEFSEFLHAIQPRAIPERDFVEELDARLKTLPDFPDRALRTRMIGGAGKPSTPTVLYNAMIHPLIKHPIKGVIWYQGEANATRAVEYRDTFPLLIESWRDAWNQPEMPFYFVQLANYMARHEEPTESDWAGLREAQTMTLELPATGMAVAIDIGEGDDIHPTNKLDVGRRLARHALAQCYGFGDLVTSGPVFRELERKGSELVLSFDHVAEGLQLKQPLDGAFAIAPANGDFHFVSPRLEGNKIVLSSPEVPEPAHVRYAWADNPTSPLYNSAGLPAVPFRTDTRPLPSENNRFTPSFSTLVGGDPDKFLAKADWKQGNGFRYAGSSYDSTTQPPNIFDGDPETRWSTNELGAMLVIDLGKARKIPEVQMSFFNGMDRRQIVQIETSMDGREWKETYFGLSSGTTEELESFPVSESPCRYVLLTFYGNTQSLWNSITELSVPAE